MSQARPFLKHAGGKTQLLPLLLKKVPDRYENYFEPFVGGGALFFALQPKEPFLADANVHLMTAYRAVRGNVEKLISRLEKLEAQHKKAPDPEKFYYDRRKDFNELIDEEVEIAALYIYLNKTCWNGLFRVNSKGGFNVPCGRYVNPTICDADNLRECSKALKKARLPSQDFRLLESGHSENPHPGDFLYADPPYAPISDTSYFTSYTKGGFGPKDQEALAFLAVRLKAKGVHVLLSNSFNPEIVRLYRSCGFSIETIMSRRSINSEAFERGKIKEILIS